MRLLGPRHQKPFITISNQEGRQIEKLSSGFISSITLTASSRASSCVNPSQMKVWINISSDKSSWDDSYRAAHMSAAYGSKHYYFSSKKKKKEIWWNARLFISHQECLSCFDLFYCMVVTLFLQSETCPSSKWPWWSYCHWGRQPESWKQGCSFFPPSRIVMQLVGELSFCWHFWTVGAAYGHNVGNEAFCCCCSLSGCPWILQSCG